MDIDYDKMWNELVDEILKEEKQEGELTIHEFSEKYELGRKKAIAILDDLVARGMATKRIARVRSGRCLVYKPLSTNGK